jgi:hypothetical protein
MAKVEAIVRAAAAPTTRSHLATPLARAWRISHPHDDLPLTHSNTLSRLWLAVPLDWKKPPNACQAQGQETMKPSLMSVPTPLSATYAPPSRHEANGPPDG